MEIIRRVFQPAAESNLTRMDFEDYVQGAHQPVSQYASTKLALYHASEPVSNRHSYAYFRSHALKGIYSGYIKNEVICLNPVDEQALWQAMTTAMSQASEAY